MIFYKIEGIIIDEGIAERFESDPRTVHQENRSLALKVEQLNKKLHGGRIFATEICDGTITLCAVVKSKNKLEKIRTAFSEHTEIATSDVICEEITIQDFKHNIERADHHGLVRDSDEILEDLKLDRLCPRGFRGMDWGENIFDLEDRKTINRIAEKNLVCETLIPEMDRIYAGKAVEDAIGNPVQYFLRSDDKDVNRAVYRSLLSALYENGRLESRRYSYLDFTPGNLSMSDGTLEALYRCSRGACIVIRHHGDDCSDDDYASGEEQFLEMVGKAIRKYHNDVLTIVSLDRECTKAKDILYRYIGDISVIEIEEELAKGERARNYLNMLAKNHHVSTDEKLLSKVEEDKGYLSNDLKEIFNAWYDENLKKNVFPQYAACTSARSEIAKQAPKGSAYDELMEMVGLTEAKNVIKKALNFYKIQKMYGDKGINMQRPAMHMVFTGNPGSAKTTVARLFARIMKENDILSKGNLYELGRADIIAKYVGWTAKNVKEKFEQASGSVLFIDEAYSLCDDRKNSFGDEAISAIVQEMENHRDDVICIFAGYPDKMEEWLSRNQGLRSRIAFHVPFEDYNAEELSKIADLMCEHQGLKLTEGAQGKLMEIFEEARMNPEFGNGRFVRNALENARMNQAGRILQLDVDSVTDEMLSMIEADDIEAPKLKHETEVHRTIGFCA